MPQTPHSERHFTAGEAVRDVVIGMSDGLTVPFAKCVANSHNSRKFSRNPPWRPRRFFLERVQY